MIGFVIVGHGEFPLGILSALGLLTGNLAENIRQVCFLPQESPEEFQSKLSSVLDKMSDYDGIVVFADLYFGTPFNVAVKEKLHRNRRIEVVGGANLTAILEAYMAEEMDVCDLVTQSVDLGRQQLKPFVMEGVEDEPDDDL